MKKLQKAITLGLAGTMALSLAACGNTASSAAESESVSATPAATAEPTATPEPTTTPEPEVEITSVADIPWVKSHDPADFTVEDLFLANSASLLAPTGSGKALKVDVTQYEVSLPEGGGNARMNTEPSYVASFYNWFDEEGALNWIRDSLPYANNAYNHVVLDGDYGYSLGWDENGLTNGSIYTETSYQKSVCDVFYPLYTMDTIAFNSVDAFSLEESTKNGMNELYLPYGEQLGQATYRVFLSDSQGSQYEVYIDDNMAVKAILSTSNFGVHMAALPTIVDAAEVPQLPDFSDKFVDCTIIENGKEYTVSMLSGGATNYIRTNPSTDVDMPEATITSDTEVTTEDGATTTIPNATGFTISGPTTFTVNYTLPEASDSSAS